MYQLFKCYYIPLEKNISSLYKSMLSVISRIMMFYETDVLEIKCDFFYLIVQVVKKDLRWPWLLFTSKKEKARIKKTLGLHMCFF